MVYVLDVLEHKKKVFTQFYIYVCTRLPVCLGLSPVDTIIFEEAYRNQIW